MSRVYCKEERTVKSKMNQFSRLELLLGREAVEKLQKSRVIIFGIGGVGGYAAEALARSGVGRLDLVDHDTVALTNLNRQIIATHSTIGRYKVEVMRERILDINPEAEICIHNCFYLPENREEFDFTQYDYIVDAIDTVTGKLELAVQAKEAGTPIISSMGAGNKLEASAFQVADIYETSVCPLARVMRRELRKRGIHDLKVVYSKEEPLMPQPIEGEAEETERRALPGSAAFVPSVAGLMLAGEVVRDLVRLQ